jgi:hypothetical protein
MRDSCAAAEGAAADSVQHTSVFSGAACVSGGNCMGLPPCAITRLASAAVTQWRLRRLPAPAPFSHSCWVVIGGGLRPCRPVHGRLLQVPAANACARSPDSPLPRPPARDPAVADALVMMVQLAARPPCGVLQGTPSTPVLHEG